MIKHCIIVCCFALISLLERQCFASSLSARMDYLNLPVRDTGGVLTEQDTRSIKMLLPILGDAFDVNNTVSTLSTESLTKAGIELSEPDFSFIETAKDFSTAWRWKEINVAESFVEVCNDSDTCFDTSVLKNEQADLKDQYLDGIFIRLYITATDAEGLTRKVQFLLMKTQAGLGQKLLLAPTGEMFLAKGESVPVNPESDFGKSLAGRSGNHPVPFDVGDKVPDVTFFDIAISEPVQLSSLRGKVVLLDFWATWCGPCQKPMAHAQAIAEKNKDSWKGRVVILGASVDDSIATVKDHVKKNGWDDIHHVWCGETEDGGGAKETFKVTGVPTSYLIDQQGQIRLRGHPIAFDMETEINKLLSDK